jgi:Sec-independent protein translocase protein TatA
MALDPLELGVIAVVGIAIFIWGPEKVPEIAKTIGTARKEIDVYTKQLQGITKELQTSMTTGNLDNLSSVLGGAAAPISGNPTPEEIASVTAGSSTYQGPTPTVTTPVSVLPAPLLSVPPPVTKSADQLLLEMAKKLGVSTQGKSRDEIQNEILSRAATPVEALPASVPPVSEAVVPAPTSAA